MKKLLYLILLFLVLPFTGFAQTDTTTITNTSAIVPSVIEKQQHTFKNQLDLDVYVLGVEVSYKRRVSPSLFFWDWSWWAYAQTNIKF